MTSDDETPNETFVVRHGQETKQPKLLAPSEIPVTVRKTLNAIRKIGYEPAVGHIRNVWTVLVTAQTADGRYLVFGANFDRKTRKQFDVQQELLINFAPIETTSLTDAMEKLAGYEPAPFTIGVM